MHNFDVSGVEPFSTQSGVCRQVSQEQNREFKFEEIVSCIKFYSIIRKTVFSQLVL